METDQQKIEKLEREKKFGTTGAWVGGIGGGAGNQLGIVIVCTTICHNTSDNPSDLLPIIGTPTNVLKALTGSGFCQCMQAHMSMNAVTGESYPTESEVQQVNSALNTGVFLE